MNDSYRVIPLLAVNRDKLIQFYRKAFPQKKADFLIQHGDWWQHGNWDAPALVTEGGDVIAYSSFISVKLMFDGSPGEYLWWHDMVVLPEYRGRKLQVHLNQYVNNMKRLLLGFPNAAGAKVYKRSGWSVRNDEGDLAYPNVRYHPGLKGKLVRTASRFLSSLWGSYLRMRLSSVQPKTA